MSVVLVVDDEPDMLEILASFLAEHRVLCASDVATAMEIIRSQPCDLVITDMRMPGPSGRVLIQSLRAEDSNLPIVVVSGFGRDEGIDVNYWLAKPFRRAELLGAVATALAPRGSRPR